MFEELIPGAADGRRRRRYAASVAIASAVYALVGTGLVVLASTTPPPQEKELEVSFEKTLPKKALPPPPPPPPPKVERKQVERPKVPIPPKEVVIPKALPKEAPPEADPKNKPDFGSGGVEGGIIGGTGSGPPPPPEPPPPPPPKRAEAVNLPEDADPPVPSESNVQPEYPEEARATGKEAEVILKVVITDSGKVTNIQVMRGDDPFVAAALAAVKRWSYEPAKLGGNPIAVFKIIKLKFRLST